MSSLNKILRQVIVVGCVAGQIGLIASADGQTNPSSTRKSQYSTGTSGTSGKTTPRRTTPPTGGATKVAGTPGRASLDNRPARPTPQPLRIPKLDPEMEDILVEWEQKSAKIKRLEGSFVRTTYDSVFSVEKMATGKYCFEFPDKGSFEQKGTPVKDGQKGIKYDPKQGTSERWVCDGVRILKIDEKDKSYEKVLIPTEDRGQNIRNSPLPFLFGMKADEAKIRYSFELNKAKTNENQIWLKVYPLKSQDLTNYRQAEVILDRATCVPLAVKLYDPPGNTEDVYVFDKGRMIINARSWRQWLSGVDPLKPDLRDYKESIAPTGGAGAAPGTQLAPRPTERRTTSVPSSGSKTLGSKSLPQRTAQIPEDDEPPARSSTKGRDKP